MFSYAYSSITIMYYVIYDAYSKLCAAVPYVLLFIIQYCYFNPFCILGLATSCRSHS